MNTETQAEPRNTQPRGGLSAKQRHALPPFGAMLAFEAVGMYGGIRRAALALSRDHAAVSRHLRALEAWAGVPLVDRTVGGGGQLTPEGTRFYARISLALKEIATASLELTHRGNDSCLRLWCVPGIASQWLAPRLGSFAKACPNIDLELQPTDATPDFSSHEADAALQYVLDIAKKVPCPDLRSIVIARPAVLAVASPKFVASIGALLEPADLLRVPLLHEANFSQWTRWFAAHSIDAGTELAGPKLWHGHMTIAAARRGQGVALSNAFLIGEDLRNGTLVEVGGGAPVHLGGYVFTARHDRWRDGAIQNFRRWLEQTAASDMMLKRKR